MRMSWQISVNTALILSTLYKSNYIREYYMNIKYLKVETETSYYSPQKNNF